MCQSSEISNIPRTSASCSVDAFLIDESKSGSNLFRQPAMNIIARLPSLQDPEYEMGVYLKIRNAQNGWLQLESVEKSDGGIDDRFRGLWISGKMVGVQVADYNPNGTGKPLRGSPETESKINGYASPVSVVSILDCKGKWIYTETLNIEGEKVKGWLAPEDQCANMVSSCS